MVVEMITSDSSGKFHVFLHDGGSLGVDGAKVSVFKNTYEVGLGSFLECYQSLGLESEFRIVILGYLSYESMEWSSWKKVLC